jgi:hypothetical protein
MKKYVLFLILLTFVSLSRAVDGYGQKYYAGIIGGLNFADMDVITRGMEQRMEFRQEHGIGGILGLQLNRNISLQIEPSYLKKGGLLKISEINSNVNIIFSTLEIPLLLKIGFGNQIQPYFITGPTLGYNFTAQSELTYEMLNIDVDMMNVVKRFDFGIDWGGGISIPLGTASFFLEARYNFGITNLVKEGVMEFGLGNTELIELPFAKNDKFKNKGLKLMTGIIIPLGK